VVVVVGLREMLPLSAIVTPPGWTVAETPFVDVSESVVDCPWVMEDGVATNDVIDGGFVQDSVTVTVTCATAGSQDAARVTMSAYDCVAAGLTETQLPDAIEMSPGWITPLPRS
jgi:hypothetical protein